MKRRQSNRLLSRFRHSSVDSFALLQFLKENTKPPSTNGIQIHAMVIRLGFESLVFLQTALMTMYAGIGKLRDAHRLFDEIPHRNVICWTAMMSACINNRRPDKALSLFQQMQIETVEPDRVAVTIALSACADLGALDIGEWIHAYISRHLGEDLILRNALVNMYAKCGDIKAARCLFESTGEMDVTTWTSMITAHAVHGQVDEALKLFGEMKSNGLRPNEATFVAVLTACSHGGLVEEGRRYWESLERDRGLKPRMSHYGCMVDLLCRAGRVVEAYEFIERMPVRPNAVIWRTLLGACCLHGGDVGLGAHARRKLLELEPNYVGDDVAISNVYASAGLWEAKVGARRRTRRPRRAPGCCSIEVCEFSDVDLKNESTRE